jgi:hypothetical protein
MHGALASDELVRYAEELVRPAYAKPCIKLQAWSRLSATDLLTTMMTAPIMIDGGPSTLTLAAAAVNGSQQTANIQHHHMNIYTVSLDIAPTHQILQQKNAIYSVTA